MPNTSPRRVLNQRLDMVAPRTSAVRPVPSPTTPPHSAQSCQSECSARIAPPSPATIRPNAVSTTARTLYRSMKAAAKGAIAPNRIRRNANGPEMLLRLQPYSVCNGRISTPGMPTAAAVDNMTAKVTAATTQA